VSEMENLDELVGLLKGKVSKRSVAYGPGVAHRRCDLCTMWRPPSSCSHVAGTISPGAVCKDFERAKGRA
jgi:hypothetical protein